MIVFPDRVAKENLFITNRFGHLRGRYVLLLILLFLMVVTMAGIARFDYHLTLALHANKHKALADFMSRTLLEGERMGGGDPAILFLGIALFAYLSAWHVNSPKRFGLWRPQLGFIVGTAPVVGLFMIHSLKWIVGRARPREVLMHSIDYTEWYEIGSHYITEGIYRGSFPSGHTATVMLAFSLAYLLAGDRQSSKMQRYAGWSVGSLVLIYGLIMAVSRSMTRSHWIADGIFTILASWLVIHCMYYWVLRVPRQIDYFRLHRTHPDLPPFWELRLGWYLFLATFGTTLVGLGIRAYWEQSIPWLMALIVPGLILLSVYGRCALRTCQTVWDAFDHPADERHNHLIPLGVREYN